MDNKIWLRVIREELVLLDQLATGMTEDGLFTKEEVELAISRAKMVAREFEMLLNQLPAPHPLGNCEEEIKISAETIVETQKQVIVSDVEKMDEPLPLPAEEEIAVPIILPIVEYQIPMNDPLPALGKKEPMVTEPEAETDTEQKPVPECEPVHPKSGFFSNDKEEHTVLNMDSKMEGFSLFKPAPIKSLKEGLILNDRYLFQRELFNNDKSRLDETVAALDRLDNIHEAVDYLKANFRWTKSEASEKFVQLVKRRFSN